MAENRTRGLSRIPDFGSAEDRLIGAPPADAAQAVPPTNRGGARGFVGAPGASDASATTEMPPSRRRPLKVHESLADQLRDAVLFMRGRGRPELTQNELLDEIVEKGLAQLSKEFNDGNPFPALTRRRPAATR